MSEEKESTDALTELRAVFNLFDKDGDGTISADELEDKLKAVYGKKYKFDRKEIDAMIKAVDGDGNGTIDFEEFTTMMGLGGDRRSKRAARDGRSELKEAFDVFDTDGDGSISKVEVARVMRAVGIKIDEATLDLMVKSVDIDGNGEIDFEEFCQLMSDAIPTKKKAKK